MSFLDKLSKMASITGEYVYKAAEDQIEKYTKALKKELRKKSDDQIERLYQNRYENPNFKDLQINLIEEEAHRRGID